MRIASYSEPNCDPSRPNNLAYGFAGTYERLPLQVWDLNDRGELLADLDDGVVLCRDGNNHVLTSGLDPAWTYHGMAITNSGHALIRGILQADDAQWKAKTFFWRGGEPEFIADLSPVAVNESGDILVLEGTELTAQSYLWSDGWLREIGPKGFHALCIDDTGRVGGDLFESEDVCRPARYENGGVSLFPIPAGHEGSCEAVGPEGSAVISYWPEQRDSRDEDHTIALFYGDEYTKLVDQVLWCSDAFINDRGDIAFSYAVERGIPIVFEEVSELRTRRGARYPISSGPGDFRSVIGLNNLNQVLLMDNMVIWLVRPAV